MGSGGKDKEKEQRQKKKPGRVPTSCAECRRLKLRCDRNVPCEKCVSRGCGSICPDGVLTPGKGGRLVLANTEELHERIEHMSSRNRELEHALQKLQESISDQPHPLLGMHLRLNIQEGSSSEPGSSSSSKSPSTSRITPPTHMHPPDAMEVEADEEHNLIDAFGTLVVNRRGESSFLGKTARPEYLAQATHTPRRPSSSRPSLPRLTNRILATSHPQSQSELYNDALLSDVLGLLPAHAEALHLCEIYLEYGKFLYAPVPKKELIEETLGLVYRAKQFSGFDQYHALSLLFAVFAIATLFNPSKPPYSAEAHEYYYLSRTALGFAPPFHDTTLMSIQALIHMAQFLDLSDSDMGMDPADLESAWMYVGQAVRLSQSVGLHFNSFRWKLPEEAIQRRHELFWRVFVADTWASLHLGRPPSISRAHFDCPPPIYHNLVSDTVSGSFHTWHTQYTLLLHNVMEAALGPKQPVYSAILDFDRKIRDFDVPVQWRMLSEDESSAPPPDIAMHRWLVLSSKEIVLLNLHRAYFAQALQEAPAELQRHRYLPSVVAIYRSAWRLIRGLAMTWMVIPKFLSRVNLAWSQGLSAAIVMCLFVTRAPTSHMTTAALEELDNLTSLFDSSASSCRPASKLLTSLQTLRRKAQEVIGLPHTRFHQHYPDPSSASTSASTSSSLTTPTLTTTELDRLNGKTYLHRDSEHPASTSAASSTSAEDRSRATSVTISDIAESHLPPFQSQSSENMHPTLARDVKEFGLRSLVSTGPPSMSFFDYPSDPMPVPMPVSSTSSMASHHHHHQHQHQHQRPHPPHLESFRDRESPAPETARLLLQPFHLPPRIESLHHSPYFQPTLHTHHPSDPWMDPRRMGFGSGFAPGFQSGFGGGFAASPITLDPGWSSLVEQLGF
ncbi:hypothetical protein GALMADRAFT_235239 [Galerina marginata CBS 339.88]|uniref:Zn(2)-C6 fungal-type domain-containing protein n=1 Tax=Galerina marginata (strain CBS 339.88) TaxID=685588 RepID=A0A067U182_GALM3|nr:hypothetical protein GALMADRAFT_235239 [Galerina marginata CBS 339.88]